MKKARTIPFFVFNVLWSALVDSMIVAFCANREPSSCNHLGVFYLTRFARVREIFTSVVSESQRDPHVVL